MTPITSRRSRALVFCAALVAALALGANAARAGRIVTATWGSNGKAVAVSPGDVLVVKLPGNMAAGYSWTIASRPKGLERIDSAYVPKTAAAAHPGGTFVLRFWAGQVNGTLKLSYLQTRNRRPPLKTFILRVRVG